MIFNVFSKRDKPLPDVFVYDRVSQEFRVQVFWILKRTVFDFVAFDQETRRDVNPLMKKVNEVICAEHGRMYLIDRDEDDTYNVINTILKEQNVDIVLNTIEMTFMLMPAYADHYGSINQEEVHEAICALNHRFREHGLGYEFSPDAQKLIRMDNTVTHEKAIRPALQLLTAKQYKSANADFLKALEDYKQRDYRDCLIKCGLAFESVLKTICNKRGWTPPLGKNGKPADTASPFINEIVQRTGLEGFFSQPLTLIATMRNSVAHGQAGPGLPQPPEHKARYALNATASAILFVHEAAAATP